MADEITLPSGHKATVRSLDDLTYDERDKFVIEFMKLTADETPEGALAAERLGVAVVVESWNFDLALPSDDRSVLGGLKMSDVTVLLEEANRLFKELNPDFSPSADPKATTPASNN